MRLDEAHRRFGWQGFAEEVALIFFAADADQVFELGFAFHPFGDDFEAELVREEDGDVADFGVVGVGFDVLDEGAVDFQAVDGE